MRSNRLTRLFVGYKIVSTFVGLGAVAYLMLLAFPSALFGYSVSYERFEVHSREPLDAGIEQVLTEAESKLRASPIYDENVRRSIYLTGSHGMYNFLSHKAYNSFANSVPYVNNVFINRADVAGDLVYIERDYSNSRSLSGVIAHEVAHLFIRQRYGTLRSIMMPAWKNEGYCEYVAGDSTIPLEEGMQRWRENPSDDRGYRFTKYHAMVKYLLEQEGLSVDELFTRDMDEKAVAAHTFASLK